jgi:hypothetical protein
MSCLIVVRGPHADVVTVRPVAGERGSPGREWAIRVDPLDGAAVRPGLVRFGVLVVLGLVGVRRPGSLAAASAERERGARDGRRSTAGARTGGGCADGEADDQQQ